MTITKPHARVVHRDPSVVCAQALGHIRKAPHRLHYALVARLVPSVSMIMNSIMFASHPDNRKWCGVNRRVIISSSHKVQWSSSTSTMIPTTLRRWYATTPAVSFAVVEMLHGCLPPLPRGCTVGWMRGCRLNQCTLTISHCHIR